MIFAVQCTCGAPAVGTDPALRLAGWWWTPVGGWLCRACVVATAGAIAELGGS